MREFTHSSAVSTWRWDSFAITDHRWLWAAVVWSVLLLFASLVLPWLVSSYSVLIGLALLAAVTSIYLARLPMAALSRAALLRFVLVDSLFVGFALNPLFAGLQLVYVILGGSPRFTGPLYGLLLPLVFTATLYVWLAAVSHMRSNAAIHRHAPLVIAFAVACVLVPDAYLRYSADDVLKTERGAGVREYEVATGKQVNDLERLTIGNSLQGFDGRVMAIATDRDGRVLVSGDFRYYAARDARGIVRLLPDGRLDTSFIRDRAGDPGLFAPTIMVVAADGSILINRKSAPSGIDYAGISRLTEDGSLGNELPLFGADNPAERQHVESMAFFADGSIIAGLPLRDFQKPGDTCLFRFDASGARDRAFEARAMHALGVANPASGSGGGCFPGNINVLSSGKALVEGAFPITGGRQSILRLREDGGIDPDYRADPGTELVSHSVVTPAGEFIAVVYERLAGQVPASHQARWFRLRSDGSTDTRFMVERNVLQTVERIAVQADGKILAAGSRGPKDFGLLVRLLPDGKLDTSFGGAEGVVRVNGFIHVIHLQNDGKIVIGGQFLDVRAPSTSPKVVRFNIARLNADGSLDQEFVPRAGP